MRGPLRMLAIAAGIAAIAATSFAADLKRQPSPELRSLERQVSLKLAHLSDEGPTDPAVRAQLHQALELDASAEKAMAAGAYDQAEENLVKANAILGRLGM